MTNTDRITLKLICITGLLLLAGFVFNVVGWYVCKNIVLVLACPSLFLTVFVVCWHTITGGKK